MRAVLTIALIFLAGFFIAATASKDCKYPHFYKHRTKLREIRGFKPEYISTAIGFGKREDPVETADYASREGILLSIPRNIPRGVPLEVLLQIMQKNPVLANKLMRVVMQNDQGNEESMMDRSKSERTFALF